MQMRYVTALAAVLFVLALPFGLPVEDLLDGHLDHLRDATYRKYFGID